MGGYGIHQPSRYTNNIFYNCVLNPSTGSEWQQGNFLLENGGNIVEGNVTYDNTPSTKLKYVFCEDT